MMQVQVLKKYSGPGKKGEQDILFLLRPQTNNCYFESLFLSTVRSSKEYKHKIWLEYLANMPGELIQQKKLMERHYEHRLFFARGGLQTMTPSMRIKFESHFLQTVEKSEIYGAYSAIERLNITAQELFNIQVNHRDHLQASGQSIKRIPDKDGKSVFIINADIPALMQFNHIGTNSAVMVFRTTFTYKEINKLVLYILDTICKEIFNPISVASIGCRAHLASQDIIDLQGNDICRHKRLFHYSYGPFNQIIDMRDFLYNEDGSHVNVEEFTFVKFLKEKGIDIKNLNSILRNPIIQISEQNNTFEESLFVYSHNMNFEKAYSTIKKIISQQVTEVNSLVY